MRPVVRVLVRLVKGVAQTCLRQHSRIYEMADLIDPRSWNVTHLLVRKATPAVQSADSILGPSDAGRVARGAQSARVHAESEGEKDLARHGVVGSSAPACVAKEEGWESVWQSTTTHSSQSVGFDLAPLQISKILLEDRVVQLRDRAIRVWIVSQ